MKQLKNITVAALALLSCSNACLATPKNLHNIPTAEHVQKAGKAHSKEANEERSGDREVSTLVAKYAEYIKKAAAAVHITKKPDYEVEKALWADYKSGKYAKNKSFVNNMRQAEPLHKRIRAVLKNFETPIFPHLDKPSKHRPATPVGDFNATDKRFDPHKDSPAKKRIP